MGQALFLFYLLLFFLSHRPAEKFWGRSPSRRAKRKGVGGNSAFPLRNQIEVSPAVLLVKSRTPHKSFLFLLEEKNRRAQIKNCEENFFAGWRGFRATAGLAFNLDFSKCDSWRRGGDSNPRDPCESTRFPSERTKPLCDLSPFFLHVIPQAAGFCQVFLV